MLYIVVPEGAIKQPLLVGATCAQNANISQRKYELVEIMDGDVRLIKMIV